MVGESPHIWGGRSPFGDIHIVMWLNSNSFSATNIDG